MKKRAGLVGERGLGPLVGHLHADAPELRVHLVGHSFGARLVSFCLAGLPPAALEPRSPVKSVLLIQGAFSHFAFAEELPHDRSRSGALAGMAARVDGPLVVSHSVFDTAVGRLYPLASIASGQDSAAMDDLLYRWGAIGHDGAQAVGAAAARLGAVGAGYEFRAGRFLNVDADEVIRSGQPPSGAHSDIFHPELAWVAVAAAGIA
jgi:pimeloyl-ACP methyl ester carboxylesterase